MAGVGIRYFEIACALSACHDVILAAPVGSHLPAHSANRFKGSLHLYEPVHPETLANVIQNCDVLLAYPDTLWQCRVMLSNHAPVVAVDGYDITLLEHLELDPTRCSLDEQWQWLNQYQVITQYVLARGDLFLAGSERQRDWWLGALAAAGRVNPLTYHGDPTLRALVALLPYGIPEQLPKHTQRVMRGIINGIGADDKIVLWGGGAWEWLDPLTLIYAAAQIAARRTDVKFVFPGLGHPANDSARLMPIQQRAMDLARELGLLDRIVFMGNWVAYDDWSNYLLESDIGVSLHRDHLEARLSVRTRVMSYVWAGLPMVLTQGDELAERMHRSGVAQLVNPGDADGLVRAILAMLAQDKTSLEPKFAELRPVFYWSVAVQPLRRMCDRPARALDKDIKIAASMGNSIDSSDQGKANHAVQALPTLQLPTPKSFVGRLLKPLLDALFLWYMRALAEQQNKINALILQGLNQAHQQVSSLQTHVQGLQEVSDDTRRHVFGLQAHVQGLQEVSDDTRRHVFGLQAHVQGLQEVSDDTRRRVTEIDERLSDTESLQTEVIAALGRHLNSPS
jgi:hypothetical protein